jgi:hypothetical protein
MHCHKVETQTDVKQIHAITTLSASGWDPVALRTELLNDPDLGPILQEVETRQQPEWKDIADHSYTYKSYWAQWKLVAMRNGVLQHNWESANRQSQIVQIVLPWSRMNNVLTKLYGGLSGGHLGVNKTLNKVQQQYYWLQARGDNKRWWAAP